jgi:Bifunctional DNA primase/polymerase, N-terminal
MTATTTTMVDAALAYARRGWPVVPLYTVRGPGGACDCRDTYKKGELVRQGGGLCDSPGKHPRTANGVDDATTDEARIRRWWTMWPLAGVAIDLERAGLIDVAPDSVEWQAEFIARGLPLTANFRSGGGDGHEHHLYQRPDDCPITKINKPGEYDLIVNGYCVAPPTVHQTGQPYAWNLRPEDAFELPFAPEWASEMLKGVAKIRRNGRVETTDTDGEPPVRLSGEALERWCGRVFKAKEDGTTPDRSESLYFIGKALADAGIISRQIIAECLRERDSSLGWGKYVDRNDADVRYDEIADLVIQRRDEDLRSRIHIGGRREPEPEPGSADPETGEVPEELLQIICNGRQLRDVTDDALAALLARNKPPLIFQRGKEMVRVVRSAEHRPVIQPLQESALRGELARSADWATVSQKGKVSFCPPTLDVVRDLANLRSWPDGIPPLVDIIEAPALRPDGSIIDAEGFDPSTGVFYMPDRGLDVGSIPLYPTRDELLDALSVMDDIIGEFPFENGASMANALALALTPLMRACLGGAPVPMAILDAPQQGSGKSLLARVVSIIATGQEAAAFTAPTEEAEWRKSITAMVRAGSAFVLIDNVDLTDWRGDPIPLRSAALSAILTTSVHRDRILGCSTMVDLPTRATWALSGNNVQVSGDLIRRCYRIRIDAKMARPWTRAGFTHPELVEYVRGRRGQILGALLTLCRGWFGAGCPPTSAPLLGSFEAWSRTVGGILEVAGVEGFLSDQDAMYASADVETPEWEAFLICWMSLFGDGWITTADLNAAIQDMNRSLREALPGDLAAAADTAGFPQKLGMAIGKKVGTRYGDKNMHVEMSDENHAKIRKWRVACG